MLTSCWYRRSVPRYDLPVGATNLGLRNEASTRWWNEIIGFDNIRITSGEAEKRIDPQIGLSVAGDNIAIAFQGVLQASDEMNGTYTDISGVEENGSVEVTPDGVRRFYRGRQ
ncbi:MAG TPA: hypothetical protein EYQ50_21700 [Verrucomicrobiales bacterium]|nr:hypothetical protein [Verrucomicrobiales bacterium]